MTPDRDPIAQLQAWKRDQAATGLRRLVRRALRWGAGGDLPEEDAAALATAAPDGRPSLRMVLVRRIEPAGLVFFTSGRSRKGAELAANPHAALLFHWAWPPRQARVEGPVEPIAAPESDAYWRSRPRGSQLAAVASAQSAPIPSREALLRRLAEVRREHQGREVPRPPWWGGWRVVPEAVELWEGRADRLHERLRFHRAGPGSPWVAEVLQP